MLIQGYYPVIGGAERQLTSLAPALQAHGIEVHVLTRRSPGLAPHEVIDGVSVHRLPSPGSRALKSLAFTLSALRLIRILRPHVVHAHDLYSPATTALLAKKLFGVPVVAKVPRGGHLGDIARIESRALGRRRLAWLCERIDRFVVISGEIDGELAARGVPREHRVAVPNAVDTERFRPASAEHRKTLRRQLELPDAPVVVFTGRLAPEKRLHDLIAIWPEVRVEYPEALLLLVGVGDEQASLARAAGAGVRLHGAADDVVPILQAADLFVLPSSAEGLSNSLLEAMATGLPCVATAVGGAPELIEPGESGWLVPAADRGELARAVLAALAEPAAATAVGLRARGRVVGAYSLQAVAARYPDLYRSLR
jgi:glycosyltransferase involved in cell wall biosynthesis